VVSGIYNNQTSKLIVPRRVRAPCDLAKNIYQHYVNFLRTFTPIDSTLVIASEELERNPARIWRRLVSAVGLPSSPEPQFESFSKVCDIPYAYFVRIICMYFCLCLTSNVMNIFVACG
jgi:hypothetical protein